MAAMTAVSGFVAAQAQARNVEIVHSSAGTAAGERALWPRCVSWGVNPMPNRLVALDLGTGSVVGASYYDDAGFLSALAVLPERRGARIGKLLIAATLGDYARRGVLASSLHVLASE